MNFILGKKLEMSQIFDKEGNVIPITLIEAGPCQVTQVKTEQPPKSSPGQGGKKDGYDAVQIGFEELKKKKKIKKTMKGKEFRHIREFMDKELGVQNYELGNRIDVSVFKEGDKVKISGISKGKGFQGVVKRWNFNTRPASHGMKHDLRTLGSTGSSFPERVIKGRKMPGRMGGERVTVKNLEVVKIDKENNLLAVKGAVPGRKGTLLEIRG